MTEPKDLPYTIAGRELVMQIPDLRVQILTLGPGETIPWHHHTTVSDAFIGLEGVTVVDISAPPTRHELKMGEHCYALASTPHEVSSKDGKGCRFAIVQGVGDHDFILD